MTVITGTLTSASLSVYFPRMQNSSLGIRTGIIDDNHKRISIYSAHKCSLVNHRLAKWISQIVNNTFIYHRIETTLANRCIYVNVHSINYGKIAGDGDLCDLKLIQQPDVF